MRTYQIFDVHERELNGDRNSVGRIADRSGELIIVGEEEREQPLLVRLLLLKHGWNSPVVDQLDQRSIIYRRIKNTLSYPSTSLQPDNSFIHQSLISPNVHAVRYEPASEMQSATQCLPEATISTEDYRRTDSALSVHSTLAINWQCTVG